MCGGGLKTTTKTTSQTTSPTYSPTTTLTTTVAVTTLTTTFVTNTPTTSGTTTSTYTTSPTITETTTATTQSVTVTTTATTSPTTSFHGICSLSSAFDLVFLLDMSGSVTDSDIVAIKAFVTDLVDRLAIGRDGVRVATVLFHNTAEELFNLDEGISKDFVIAKISEIEASSENRGTATAAGINYVVSNIFDKQRGFRAMAPIVITITDGVAGDGVQRVREGVAQLIAAGAQSIAVAFGVAADQIDKVIVPLASEADLQFAVTSSADLNFFLNDIEKFYGCDVGFFEQTGCSNSGDRICVPCTASCSPGRYIKSHCTRTEDISCGLCDNECPFGSFIQTPCNGVDNRVCNNCTVTTCEEGAFLSSTCSGFCNGSIEECSDKKESDGICTRCSVCSEGYFETARCNATSDVTCTKCQTCGDAFHEIQECTSTQDRKCEMDCNLCDHEHYEVTSCDPVALTQTECARCREKCLIGQYESSPCSLKSNRECKTCTQECNIHEFVKTPCNETQDLTCAPCSESCPVNHFVKSNCSVDRNLLCSECSICETGVEFESRECTTMNDRECSLCSPCRIDEFEAVPCTPTSNRVCMTATVCDEDSFELTPLTQVEDRKCQPHRLCDVCTEFEEIGPTTTSNRVCSFIGEAACVGRAITDLTFVIDVSGSVGPSHFDDMKRFLITLVSRRKLGFDQTCEGTRVAIVAFADKVVELLRFDETVDNNSVISAINALEYNTTAAVGILGPAIKFLEDTVMTKDHGYRGDSSTVFIIIDGPTPPTDLKTVTNAAESLAKTGVELIGIGLHNTGSSQTLESLVISGDHIFELSSFDELTSESFTKKVESRVLACELGFYEALPCTSTANRVCEKCSSCEAGFFIKTACSTYNDTICIACNRECDPGFYRMEECSSDSDLRCELCSTTCPANTYQAEACGRDTDILCNDCDDCLPFQYRSANCEGTNPGKCNNCTKTCKSGQFTTANCNSTADRVCKDCAPVCNVDEFEVVPCTTISNRICLKVSSAFDPTSSYESAGPTSTSDRQCLPLSSCLESEYAIVPATTTSDVECAPVSVCPEGEVEDVAPTSTSDRTCIFDGICSKRSGFDLVFLLDGSGSVGNAGFEYTRTFVADIIKGLEVSTEGVHVAILEFHNSAEVILNFDSGSKSEILSSISRLTHPTGNQGSAMAHGVQLAADILGESERNSVVMMITDGGAAEGEAALELSANTLKRTGAAVFVVGVGDRTNTKDIAIVASGSEYVLKAKTFAALADEAMVSYIEQLAFGCDEGEYEVSPCTADTDRVCATCPSCDQGFYAAGACVGSTTSVCAACTKSCPADHFITRECSGTSDLSCARCSNFTCAVGEFAVPCSRNANKRCEICSSSCPTEQFQSADCTADADRTCDKCHS